LVFSFELFLNRVRRRETEEESAEGTAADTECKGAKTERERERES
jgi:hypothetical protein